MESLPPESRAAESPPPQRNTEGRPPVKRHGNGRWKPVLAAAVVIVIVWQLIQVLTRGGGNAVNTSSGGPRPAAKASTSSHSPAPTPTAGVTLGGQTVPAGGGPIIVLNPGLVAPGGQVGVDGSGFDPGAPVEVRVRASRSGLGTVVARGKTTSKGSLAIQFNLPSSLSNADTTVVAQESGSNKTATAQLVTPGGVGNVSIVGKAVGRPGDRVTFSAAGFGPGETVNVYWGRIGGTPAVTLTADSSGSIGQASVQVGVAPVGPTTLVLVGAKTETTATAAYQMLGLYPSTMAHPYAVEAGKTQTFSGSGFAPGERVLIYLNASSGTPALITQATSSGRFIVSYVVPFGLKGSQTLTAIGEQSRASVSSGFDVLPYSPVVQASTYGALPGTSLSFYASGFAANEVVLVYLGRSGGAGGQLVTAFRVNGQGSAAAAGSYVIPGNTGHALYFTLVGQESGGSGTAKVSVTTPDQPVTVPSQPPYVLPPSLGGKASPSPSAPSQPAQNG